MMRDARINLIGEGANDVLKVFIAVGGLRGVGESLKGIQAALKHPLQEWNTLWRFGKSQMAARFTVPEIPVRSSDLRSEARALGQRLREFSLAVQDCLFLFRRRALERRGPKLNGEQNEEMLIAEVVFQSQNLQERLADAACDLYASSCVLSRLDSLLAQGNSASADIQAGRYFLTLAGRRIRQNLAAMWDNDDDLANQTANLFLGRR